MGVAGRLGLRAGAEGWPEWPHLPTQGPSRLAMLLPPQAQLHSSRGTSTVGGGIEALSSDPSRAETPACLHPSQPS